MLCERYYYRSARCTLPSAFLDGTDRDGSARDAHVERLVKGWPRPDDDVKDVERCEASDGELSDGRRGYTVRRRR